MEQKMKKRKGEIDGFWLFLIGLFIVLPAIKYITGYGDSKSGTGGSRTKVVNSNGNILDVDNNTAMSAVDTEIRIPIKKVVKIVKKISPDRIDPEVIVIDGKYAVTSFDKTGKWTIDMYDADEKLVNWVKVTVY
jgi:hypothetical protein